MRLTVDHTTTYSYDTPLSYGLQRVRLTPKSLPFQSIVEWDLEVEGGSVEVEFTDHYANHTKLIRISPDQNSVKIRSFGTVETSDVAGVVGKRTGYAPLWLYLRDTDLTKPGPELRKLLREADPGSSTEDIPRLHAISKAISDRVTYQTGTTDISTSGEDAVNQGFGVCQDHAHIMITMARMLGYPARYVSGYLMMNDRIDQEASHAWAEVFVPNLGWLGLDVSNQISPDPRYIHLATGLDYRDAAPISGMRFGSSNEALSVSLQVQQ